MSKMMSCAVIKNDLTLAPPPFVSMQAEIPARHESLPYWSLINTGRWKLHMSNLLTCLFWAPIPADLHPDSREQRKETEAGLQLPSFYSISIWMQISQPACHISLPMLHLGRGHTFNQACNERIASNNKWKHCVINMLCDQGASQLCSFTCFSGNTAPWPDVSLFKGPICIQRAGV